MVGHQSGTMLENLEPHLLPVSGLQTLNFFAVCVDDGKTIPT